MSTTTERDERRDSRPGGPSRNHILADENIGALLWRLSIPATLGMIVMATYNLVDAIFIGRGVGTLGLAGLAICFPVQMIVMSVGQLIGMGGASIISRALGAGDEARVHRTMGNLLLLVLVMAAGMMLLGFGFLNGLLKLFGASEQILPYAREYLSVILWGTAFRVYAMSHNNIIRSEGRAMVAMTTMLIGALVNIALDPIFIFGLGMGMRGAALATVLAQTCTTTFIAIYFASGRSGLKFRLNDMRPSLPIVKETMAVGVSSFGRMAAGSVLAVILNRSLGHYGGNVAIAAYGICNRLVHFLFMPVMGFAQALQPVAGFNYGARRFDGAKRALRISAFRSTVFAAGAFALLALLTRPLVALFTRDPELSALAMPALRTVSAAFPIIGIQMTGAAMFQAFGRAGPALFLSLSRQIIFLLPFVVVFPLFWGVTGVFASIPAADTLATAVTLFMMGREFRRLDGLTAASQV